MSSITVPDSPYLSLLTSRLYDQLGGFGAFATDAIRVDFGKQYERHAATTVEWFEFLQEQRPPRWAAAEPFVLSPSLDHSIPLAGYATETSVSVAHLAQTRLAVWRMRFRHVRPTPIAEQARLSRGALYMARTQGIDSAFAWLVELVTAGWPARWFDVAVCLSLLSLLDEAMLERLPAASDHNRWQGTAVWDGPSDHLDASIPPPLITHNGATDVPFGIPQQRRLIDIAGRVVERARQSSNLDEWALGRMSSQTMVSAVLRQFPRDRARLKLSVRYALNQLDEVAADINPASTAGVERPLPEQAWAMARSIVEASRSTLGVDAAGHVVNHRLLLPRLVADDILAEAELPMGWHFIGPTLALPWGAVHGWDPRHSSPDDYVPPLGSLHRDIELDAAKQRAQLNDSAVALLSGVMFERLATGDLDIETPLGMAIADHPYSDELLSVAAYLASRRGQGDQSCALGIVAILAQPDERARWQDLSRHLKAAGHLDEGFLVYAFQEMRGW